MPVRNMTVEKQMVDTFSKARGRLPKDSQDWATVMKMAYPTNELPDELKNSEAASLYSAGFSKPTAVAAPSLPSSVAPAGDAYGQSLVGQTNQAKANSEQAFDAYDSMPSGNEALRVLQEAIKAKAAPRDFRAAGIGESEIFKQAGVGGFGALSQSLNMRGQELEMNRADFANTISQMADVYKTTATKTFERYNKAVDEYKFTADMLNSHLQEINRNEQEIKLLDKKAKLDKELEAIRFGNNQTLQRMPSPSERLAAEAAGLEFDDSGNVRTPDPTTVEADLLADAIAQHESGGRYGAKGSSGENGAFQFMPATWNIISQQYAEATGINQSIPMTQENEDKVARWKIGQLLASGKTPREVALIWNGSLGGSEQGVVKSGVNSKGVKYDTGAYANSVMNILKQKTASTPNNSNAAKTAQDIFNGMSNLGINGVLAKDRDAVNRELIKLKDEAMKSGDVAGMIRASAGGSSPSDAFKQSFEKGLNVVSQIGDLQNTIQNGGKDAQGNSIPQATGPIMGIIRGKNPYDTKAQLIKAQLSALVPNLARGVYGEVGVLTDQDIAQYTKTLPNLTSTEDVNKLLLGASIRSVQRSLENKLKVQAGTGTDVSGLLDTYNEVKSQADALLAPYTNPSSGVNDPHGILSPAASNSESDPLGIR